MTARKGLPMIRKAAAIVALLLIAVSMSSCGKKGADIAPPTVENYSYSRPHEVAVAHMDMNLSVDFEKRVLTGSVGFLLDNKTKASVVVFDTWALNIRDVVLEDDQGNEKKARFVLGDSLDLIGRPLSVMIEPNTRRVTVRYQTRPRRAVSSGSRRSRPRARRCPTCTRNQKRSTRARGFRARTRRPYASRIRPTFTRRND